MNAMVSSSITLEKVFYGIARFALFLVYFWFGILKIFSASPATPLVLALFNTTLSFLPFNVFFLIFGAFEMLIGILFVFPRATRLAAALVFLHMIAAALPLIALPRMVWQGWFIPTLEGQYIIKNVLIIALTLILVARKKAEEHLPRYQDATESLRP